MRSTVILNLLNLLAIALGQDASVQLNIVGDPIITEANVVVTVCVNLFGGLGSEPASVTLRSRDDTAKAGIDYVPLEADMTFTQADVSGTQICHNITILDDSIVESSERFAVELTNPIRLRVLQPNPVTYTLQPNVNDIDTIIVAFEQSFYSVSEGAGSVEVCLVIEQGEVDSENTVGVEIGVSPISHSIDYTATVGSDFIAPKLEFMFLSGSMSGDTSCMSVTIMDDALIEINERFGLRLDLTETVTVSKNGEEVAVVIADNDVARLVLDPTTTQYLQEGNPGDPQDSVEVCITAEADEALSLDRSIDVYIMLGGTADDEDFVLGQTSSGRATAIAFSTLGDAMCINVTIVNDDVREPNETVMLSPIPGIPTDRVVGENFTMVILDDGDVNCPELHDPTNGRVTLNDRLEGSVATYTCDSRYVLNVGSSRECGANGSWSGEQPLCLSSCNSPPRPRERGAVKFTTTTEGSQAQYTCHIGYILRGENVLECLPGGRWSGKAPLCIASCDIPPRIDNGGWNITTITEGSTTTYYCFEGYRLIGESQRTCGQDSEWSGTEPCCVGEDADCSDGATAVYMCQDDYQLEGSSHRECDCSRVCNCRRQWLGEEPRCSAAAGIERLAPFTLILLTISFIFCP